jgi:hypothetical protein
MIEIDESVIHKLIYHRISIEDGMDSKLSNTLYDFKDEEEAIALKKIFLKPFTSNFTSYEFTHDIDIELNPLFKIAQVIFDEDDFINQSKNICKHLKSVSKHPNIKDGDLFVLKFSGIKMNNNLYEGVGIYKIENKENFIETTTYHKGEAGLQFKKGIGNKRPDKACLILFTEMPYTVLVIDNASVETDYWQNEFIKTSLKKDNANNTTQFLTLTKSFVTHQFPNEFEVTKADQIDLLNRSVEYFKTHDTFDKKDFEQEVFQDSVIIKSFRNFDETYRESNEMEVADSFEISAPAVKKQARVFKSVLKLDKNFHIYIHGDRELIEQGVEKDGRKYYKIYFDQES